MPNAVILRPSVIFGSEDEFFNRFAGMAKNAPVLPIVGANTQFQPVFVDDVAQAAANAAQGQVAAGTYELGGPDVASMRDLLVQMLSVIRRKRVILNLPYFAANMMAFGFDMVQAITLGLIENKVLTRDQVKNLKIDNVVSEGAKTFADLGIDPASMASVLPDYLWCYRPSGQYSAIKESAKNLRA
jgi:NADH dehydrogenase